MERLLKTLVTFAIGDGGSARQMAATCHECAAQRKMGKSGTAMQIIAMLATPGLRSRTLAVGMWTSLAVSGW